MYDTLGTVLFLTTAASREKRGQLSWLTMLNTSEAAATRMCVRTPLEPLRDISLREASGISHGELTEVGHKGRGQKTLGY